MRRSILAAITLLSLTVLANSASGGHERPLHAGEVAAAAIIAQIQGVPLDICFDHQGRRVPCGASSSPPPLPPDPTRALIDQGNAFFNAHNYDAAIEKYKEALQIDPNNAEATRNLADARAAKQRARSNELNDEGGTFYDSRRYGEAIDKYQQALDADPSNTAAANNLKLARSAKANQEGNALYEAKQYEMAIKKYEEALAIDPSNTAAANNLKLAREAKQRARSNELNDEGGALYDSHKYGEAIDKYQQAVDADPSNTAAASNLKLARSAKANQEGGAFYDAKEYERAIRKYEEALAANPKSEAAKRNLELSRSAQAQVEAERRREQQWQQERAQEIAKNFEIAHRAERNESYSAARRAYEAVLRTDPTNLEARRRLSEVEKLDTPEGREARLLSTGANTIALDFGGSDSVADFTPNVVAALRHAREVIGEQVREIAASSPYYISIGSLADRERALFGDIKANTETYLNNFRNFMGITAECVAHGTGCQATDDTKFQEEYAHKTRILAAGWIYWEANPHNNLSELENSVDHWNRHKGGFPGFNGWNEYVEGANRFVRTPPANTRVLVRPWSGDKVFYNATDRTFAVQASNGQLKTFMRVKSKYGENQMKLIELYIKAFPNFPN